MPLEKHVDIAYRCTKQLNGLFNAVIAGDWDKAAGDVEEFGSVLQIIQISGLGLGQRAGRASGFHAILPV